jgi:hypothetical protein
VEHTLTASISIQFHDVPRPLEESRNKFMSQESGPVLPGATRLLSSGDAGGHVKFVSPYNKFPVIFTVRRLYI